MVKKKSNYVSYEEMYEIFKRLNSNKISEIRFTIKQKTVILNSILSLLKVHKKTVLTFSNFNADTEYNNFKLKRIKIEETKVNTELGKILMNKLIEYKKIRQEIQDLKSYLSSFEVITCNVFKELIYDYCSLISENLTNVGDCLYLSSFIGGLEIKEVYSKDKMIIDWKSYHDAKELKRRLFKQGLITASEFYEPTKITKMLKENNAVLMLRKAKRLMVRMYAFRVATKLAVKINKAYNVSDERFV